MDVTVTTAGGTSATSAADHYTYLAPYPFTGFFSPVDNPPTVNMVNAGQSIPIKFSLGSDLGLGIIAGSRPPNHLPCTTGAPVNAATETDTAGGSGLQYDSGSDTYAYVWKASKASAGTCQVLTLALTDGTVHTAEFQYGHGARSTRPRTTRRPLTEPGAAPMSVVISGRSTPARRSASI